MEGKTVHIALCASAKKHAQSFDELKRTAVRCASHYWTENHITFHFMHLNYNEELNAMELIHITDYNEEKHKNTITFNSNIEIMEKEDDVDVIVHKVATFGTERATTALRQWCHHVNQLKEAQWNKKKQHNSQESVHHYANFRDMPLIVIDPLDKVQQLVSRSNLYAIMHHMLASSSSSSSSSESLITKVHTPRTLNWQRLLPTHTDNNLRQTQLLCKENSNSSSSVQRWLANGVVYSNHVSSIWWIAKPDQSTGPPFTHNLLIYNIQFNHTNKTDKECCVEHTNEVEVDVAPPITMNKLLPNETNTFVLQEFYLNALPIIIKVYVADTNALFIDVRSTRSLLTQVEESMQEHTHKNNEISNVQNAQLPLRCVSIDSQDKSLFTHCKTNSKDKTKKEKEHEYITTVNMEEDNTETRTVCDADEDWDVQKQCWLEYVNTPHYELHKTIAKLVEMFAKEAKLGLSLYGFDVILVPHSLLAHESMTNESQYKLQNRETDEHCDNSSPHVGNSCFVSWTEEKLTSRYPFHLLFNKVTSERYTPTPLLLSCEAVVIDMNYFPGYKGVAERASECLLNTIVKAVKANRNFLKEEESKTINDSTGAD